MSVDPAAAGHQDLVVEVDVEIAAPLAEVWAAMVEEEHREHWWPGLALDAVDGGLLQELWTDREGIERVGYGVVHRVHHECLLYFSWADSRWGAPTTVEWRVEAMNEATRVSIRETGLEDVRTEPELAVVHRSGWRLRLDNLRRYVESAG